MTEKELYKVGRSWIGHLATNPSVRTSLNDLKGDEAKIARLINKTVKPDVKVLKKDVDGIKVLMQKAFGKRVARPALVAADDGEEGTLNRFDDPWDDVKLRK